VASNGYHAEIPAKTLTAFDTHSKQEAKNYKK